MTCERCHKLHNRCEGGHPCLRCVKRKVICRPRTPKPVKQLQRRLAVANLKFKLAVKTFPELHERFQSMSETWEGHNEHLMIALVSENWDKSIVRTLFSSK